MLRIAVCDDDKAEIRMIKRHAIEYSIKKDIEISVDGYESGEVLLNCYRKGMYDILFLDVEMENMDGIATGEQIRRLPDHNVAIIYVSNYPEYMQASFNVRATQYLSKPLSYEVFADKVTDILEYYSEEQEDVIEFIMNGDRYYVKENELIYIKSLSKLERPLLIEVQTLGGAFVAKGKLKYYLEKYKEYLFCPNRSIVVNARYVHHFCGKGLVLRNGERIDISRNRVTEVKEVVRKSIMRRFEGGRSNYQSN